MESSGTPSPVRETTIRNGQPHEFPLESILDGISDAISLLDLEWRYTYVNAHAEVLAGMKRDDLVRNRIWELFPAAIGSEFEVHARRAITEQRQTVCEHFFPTFNKWYEHRFYPTPKGLLFFTTDIDERKRLDEQVRQAEERHRKLFEATHDGILIVDDEGRYVDVNESFCSIMRASREQLIGAHFGQFIPPERLAEATAAFADLKTGNPTPVEFPLRAVDGTIVDLEWSSSSHYLPNLSFCVCRDISERRRTQQALRDSEERQRRAIEAGKVGLWEWDIPNNKVTWSDYVYELQGLAPGTFDGTVEGFAQLIDPRDRERVTAVINKALAGEAEYHVEFRAVRPDGQPKWLRTSGKVTFDEQNRPVAMHGAVIDTTAHKTAQETQAEIERQLLLLVEASGALLASPHSAQVLRTILELAQQFVSADGHSVWRKHADNIWRLASSMGLSQEFVRAGSISAEGTQMPQGPMLFEDITKEPLLDRRNEHLIREGVRSMLAIPLNIHGDTCGTVVFYWRNLHKFTQAEVRIASALGNLAASALGTAELYDRQTELRAEAEASQKRADFLAESGAVLASSLDYESTLTSVANLAVPVFADWAAVDVLDELGELRRVAIAHADPEKILFAQEFARRYPPQEDDPSLVALRTGKSFLIEEIPDELVVKRARDPEHLRLIRELGLKSVIVAPMVVSGRSLGIITFVTSESGRHYKNSHLQTAEELARRAATALDNARLFRESKDAQSELARKNEELRRANEDLNQFAYSASHDLQEPLRMVAIYSQLLKQKYEHQLDSGAQDYLNFMLEGAQRMEALLRDILAYTQVSGGDSQEITRVDASAVLQKALANLKKGIDETLAVVESQHLPSVAVLEIHLLQLFQNLIGNAIKYRADEPPRIAISAKKDQAGVLFSIKDNGIGIEPQYKEHVFGLFKRLHTTEEYAGTGVGLAICQKIVERYGGRIWVESDLGRGSTFFFSLPTE